MNLKYILTFLALFLVGINSSVKCNPVGWPPKAVFEKRLKDAGFDVGIVVGYLSSKWYKSERLDAASLRVSPIEVALAVANLVDYHRFHDEDITTFLFLKNNRFELIKIILPDFNEEQHQAIEELMRLQGPLFL